jgi:hypothetical protein
VWGVITAPRGVLMAKPSDAFCGQIRAMARRSGVVDSSNKDAFYAATRVCTYATTPALTAGLLTFDYTCLAPLRFSSRLVQNQTQNLSCTYTHSRCPAAAHYCVCACARCDARLARQALTFLDGSQCSCSKVAVFGTDATSLVMRRHGLLNSGAATYCNNAVI